jgi:dihydrofolate reductase
MKIAIIVAMDENKLIGKNNDLPWKLSADLQYFRKITMGKPLVMGRNTHQSIGRVLPGRKNIVITTQAGFKAEGCCVVSSIEQALEACGDVDEVMVMGGASLYKQFLPHADRMYLTHVHATLDDGDTWFPEWQKTDWLEVSREDHDSDDKNQYPYSFIVLDRVHGLT